MGNKGSLAERPTTGGYQMAIKHARIYDARFMADASDPAFPRVVLVDPHSENACTFSVAKRRVMESIEWHLAHWRSWKAATKLISIDKVPRIGEW